MSFLERLIALAWFLIAAAWFLFSDLVAQRAAAGITLGDWQEPLYRLCLLFLLIVGYWFMSRLGLANKAMANKAMAGEAMAGTAQRGIDPATATALALRPGARREFALGAALGWSGVVLCVLPTALIGGLVLTVFTNAHQFWLIVPDLVAVAAGTLSIEIAFRGYPFLRLIEAMGPTLGAFFMAVVYAIWRTHSAPATTATVLVSFFIGLALALAVLRTRALWVGWGFHFAWVAALCMLFGLPVVGSIDYSPVLVTNTVGAPWITGGAQGPEGSAFAVLISFLLIFVMVKYTSDLKYKYGFSEIVPGGVPVDIDAAARRQHEAAMAEVQPQPPALVQIFPAQPLPAVSPRAPADSPGSTPADPEVIAPGEQSGEDGLPAERSFSESDTESPR
ncbi:MAG TPA: CPBP family intramembrane glutamic endopeptidase [Acidobacteriaceae bacterium]|nr:CPBP family intramembrane glutamic endopeptidase [Acidobacteriaceae bacterium]